MINLNSNSTCRYDLLPFYSRFVATLYPCMPDVAAELSKYLHMDFKHLVRKKDQIFIETKLKSVRFIGKLICIFVSYMMKYLIELVYL